MNAKNQYIANTRSTYRDYKKLQSAIEISINTINTDILGASMADDLSESQFKTLKAAAGILSSLKHDIKKQKEEKAVSEKNIKELKQQREKILNGYFIELFPCPTELSEFMNVLYWRLSAKHFFGDHIELKGSGRFSYVNLSSDLQCAFSGSHHWTLLTVVNTWWHDITSYLRDWLWAFDDYEPKILELENLKRIHENDWVPIIQKDYPNIIERVAAEIKQISTTVRPIRSIMD